MKSGSLRMPAKIRKTCAFTGRDDGRLCNLQKSRDSAAILIAASASRYDRSAAVAVIGAGTLEDVYRPEAVVPVITTISLFVIDMSFISIIIEI